MKFNIIVRKCEDAQRASIIADEIAKWSGNTKHAILQALMRSDISIRKFAVEEEAYEIKKRFGSVGAVIDLIPAPSDPAAAYATNAKTSKPAQNTSSSSNDDDDDDDGKPHRTVSEQEFIARAKARPDIFHVEKERRVVVIQALMFLISASLCGYLSTLEMINVTTDFIEKMPEERTATLTELPSTLEQENLEKQKEKEKEDLKTDKKEIKPTKKKGAGGQSGGGGDPRARITKKGVLGIITGQVRGKTVASADIFGKGGFATGIDAILNGVGGLKGGGGGGVGRKGAAGIGYGAGYGSGFGGGSSVDDLIGNLIGGGGDDLSLKKKGSLAISTPEFTKGGSLTGGRSRASIMRVVMQNLAALRYAYNQRLREKPGLKGRITVKFAIDEFGKVIFCQVVSSTMSDPPLEETVIEKIKRWVFEKIDKPGDVTEVIYPFVFSQ